MRLGMIGLAVLLLLRLWWLDSYPFSSDEPQYAHVAWSWTQGLLPYRDVFDNHGPLFGWLESWPLRMIGESPDVLDWLRLSVEPWYFLTLAGVWLIGRRLYGRGLAWAAMFLCALYPRFFLISGQFRTDDMWMGLWLAALAVALSGVGRPLFWRWFGAGLLAGGALSVSQKTLVLLLTCLVAGLVVAVPRTLRLRPLATALGGSLLGVAVLPLLFIGWFHAQGCPGAFWYGTIGYNLGGDGVGRGGQAWRVPLFVLASGAGIALAAWRLRRDGEERIAWRVFLGLQGWLFLLLILLIWPLLTAQDFLPVLPVLPVLAISSCGLLSQLPVLAAHPRRRLGLVVLGLGLESVGLLYRAPPWHDQLAPQRELLREVLHYSDPADTVMDARGASIFRMRPYYPVLKSMAMKRLRRHLISDTIAYELRRHRTMLVVRKWLPSESDAFVARNYLPLQQQLYLAGRRLPASSEANGQRYFMLELPGAYTLSDGHRAVRASLDGNAPADHWQLSAGPHVLTVKDDASLALLWTQGWQRGWRPALAAAATLP